MEASKAASAGSGKASGDDRVAELETELKELTGKLQQMTDIAGRAQADLQNAKIRMQKDGEDIRKFAAEAFILKLLPTIDNFQRAFTHLPEDLKNHEWLKGITAIEQDLMRNMAELGLKKMECLGQQVDTARHEVITIGPGKEGEIITVIEDGYELNGKILRPAKVIVGDGIKA
ncbi:MAG: nucleotide exchange factor GrpE [Candidatus Peribacteraceae bacterium]|nr:nucleotide exchange factor GrpE [Candidatus Peribacteraceae bacterium]